MTPAGISAAGLSATGAPEMGLEVERALARGIVCDALSQSLRPPAGESLDKLEKGEPSRALREAARALGDDVAGAAEELVRAAGARTADLDPPYQRLFGHTARGKVSPYEIEYGVDDLFRQAEELSDLGGFYRAFGLAMPESAHERCDHISVELEFLAFLSWKEAWEIENGGGASYEEVRKAQRLFLRDHLGRFGRACARKLAQEADHPFYRAVGDLCFLFLTRECSSFGIEPGAEFIPLSSGAEPDVPMACGGCKLLEAQEGASGEEGAP